MANLNVVLNLSQTGASAVSGALGGLGHALSNIAQTAAGFALGGGLTELPGLLKDAALAAADDAASVAKLQTAVTNSGVAWSKYADQLDGTINAAMRMGFTDDQTRDSLSLLIAQTGSATEAQKRYKLAMDLARGANIDVVTASKLLGKVTDDNVSVLSRYGIVVQKGASEAELFGKIQAKFGGQADAFANSTKGQMEAASIAFSEMKESLGYAVLPLLTKLGSIITDNLPAIQSFVALLGQGLSAGVDLAFRAFDTLWGVLQPVTDAIGSALPKAWEAAQAVLATFTDDAGALGIALQDVRDVFGDTVANAIEPFVNTVMDAVVPLQQFADGLIGIGKALLGGDFAGALAQAGTMLQGMIDSIVGWVTGGGPKQVADALLGLADSAWEWLKTAAGTVEDALYLNLIIPIKNWVNVGGLTRLEDALLGLAEGAWSWLTGAAATAGDFLNTNLVQPIQDWVAAGGIKNVGNALLGLAESAWDWIKGAASTATEFLDTNLVEPVRAWVASGGIDKVATALVGLAESAWSWVLTAKDTAVEKLGGLVNAAAAWVTNGGLANMVTGLEGLAVGAWDWVLKAKDFAIDKLGGLVDGVKAWIDAGGPARVAEQLWALAARAWDWVQQAANTAIENLTPIITSIKNWTTETAGPAVLAAGKDLGQKLYDGVNEAWNAAVTAGNLQPGLDKLAAGLEKVGVPDNLRVSWALWGDTLKIVSGWLDQINENMSGANGTSTLMKIAEGAVSAFVVVLGGLTRIGESASLIVNDIVRSLDNMKNWLSDHHFNLETWLESIFNPLKTLGVIDWGTIGSNIVQGLIGGIESKLPDLEGVATRLANLIPDWMKKLLDISSPSQVMHDVGEDTIRGLMLGLRDQERALAIQTQATMQKGLVKPISDAAGDVHDQVGDILRDLSKLPTGVVSASTSQPPPGGFHTPPGTALGLPVDSHGNPYPNPAIAPWTGQAHPPGWDPNAGYVPPRGAPNYGGSPLSVYPYGAPLPTFDTGGIVPGLRGAPMVAVVHGGEVITPPGQGGGNVYHLYGDNIFTAPSVIDALSELSQMVG